ncbi:MAG: sporulation protein YtfJ [Ruminococcus sp.]|nr:sporulation protein YtfJ [Ruminococcus sp.]
MEKKKTSINELLGVSMEKIKEMADVNSVIGDPITTADGTTIIPISKVTYGFASGGSDLPSKYDKDLFAGGAGAGISIKPEGFLIISPDGSVQMVKTNIADDPISSAIGAVPAIFDKIQGIIANKKSSKEEINNSPEI